MDNDKVQMMLMSYSNKIPQESMYVFKQALDKADNEVCTLLCFTNLKSPIITVILSLFFGYIGVDRFYIGDIYTGIIKIILAAVSACLPWLLLFTGIIPLFIVGVLIASAYSIFYIVDIFLCYKACKTKNFQNLLTILQTNHSTSSQQS